MLIERNYARLTMDEMRLVDEGTIQVPNDFRQYRDQGTNWLREHTFGPRGTSFSNDPDKGTRLQRLSGDFQWAMEVIRNTASAINVGNIESLMPEYEFGHYDGTEIDFDQYLRHDPRCMGRLMMHEAEDGERVIRIAVSLGGSGLTSAKDLALRVAKILKVATQYEEAGYAVEMFGACTTITTDLKHVGAVVIDCSHSSVGQSVAALCSTLLYRTVGFELISAIGHSPNNSYPIWMGLYANKIPEMNRLLRSKLGNDLKIVYAGMTDEQIAKELS